MQTMIVLPGEGYEIEIKNHQPLAELLYGYGSPAIVETLTKAIAAIETAADQNGQAEERERQIVMLKQLRAAFDALQENPVIILETENR